MKAIVINYGHQSSDNISSVLHRLNILNRVIEYDEEPKGYYTHIILSGGPDHVYDENSGKLPLWVCESNVPVLGICYGMQLIIYSFGGTVVNMGYTEKKLVNVTEIFNQTQHTKLRWMNRTDIVTSIPDEFHITGITENNHIAAITDNKRWFGIQYHPESSHALDLDIFRLFFAR